MGQGFHMALMLAMLNQIGPRVKSVAGRLRVRCGPFNRGAMFWFGPRRQPMIRFGSRGQNLSGARPIHSRPGACGAGASTDRRMHSSTHRCCSSGRRDGWTFPDLTDSRPCRENGFLWL